MNEPLFWNPLPDAAAWLTAQTGRAIDSRTLIDLVIKMGKQGDPAPTIIKALLPRELRFATTAMSALLDKSEGESDVQSLIRQSLLTQFGPLPAGMIYMSEAHPSVAPLAVSELIELLLYGQKTLAGLNGVEKVRKYEMVWMMPWGTSHCATFETCGINRSDLAELGAKLSTTTQPRIDESPSVPNGAPAESPCDIEITPADRRNALDVTDYRGVPRRILEKWGDIEKLHGSRPDGRQVWRLLSRDQTEGKVTLKSVQNALSQFRAKGLIH